jgi:hypothetical protein
MEAWIGRFAVMLCFFAFSVLSYAGFDFPLGKPNGVGYGPGFGGSTFLELDSVTYKCGSVYHPGDDWNSDGSGLDVGGDRDDKNDPVFAVSDGTIESASFVDSGWGNVVLIRHDGNFVLPEGGRIQTVWSQYGHLASLTKNPRTNMLWRKGEKVLRGEQIGNVGDYLHGSGKAFHLHFEIRKKFLAAGAFSCNLKKDEVESLYTSPSAFVKLNRAAAASPSYTFKIDSFKVIKNGAVFFQDSFSDGTPPPNAPNFASGNAATYFVFGNVGPEKGGRLTIDSSSATIADSIPPPGSFLTQRVWLQTNTDSNNLENGLKIDDTFSVSAIFDLSIPDDSVEGYGIALSDSVTGSVGNDDLRVYVRRSGEVNRITFALVDRTNLTFTVLASTPLNSNHSQIELTLSRPTTANNRIIASYAYRDNGVTGPASDLISTGEIFRGERFTRALFFAETRLP